MRMDNKMKRYLLIGSTGFLIFLIISGSFTISGDGDNLDDQMYCGTDSWWDAENERCVPSSFSLCGVGGADVTWDEESESFLCLYSTHKENKLAGGDIVDTAKVLIRYADGTYKQIETLYALGVVNLNIFNLDAMTVYEGGKEIAQIDMNVYLTLTFKGDPDTFEVYKTLMFQVKRGDDVVEHVFQPQMDTYLFKSGEPKLVASISFTPKSIEKFADEATEGIIDGDYDISSYYRLDVFGVTLNGGSVSIPITIDTFEAEATITGGSDPVTIVESSSDDDYVHGNLNDNTFEEIVAAYDAARIRFGTVKMGKYTEATSDGINYFPYCHTIDVINARSDIEKHAKIGFTLGGCP